MCQLQVELAVLSAEPAELAPDPLCLRRLDVEHERRVHKLQWRRQGDDSVSSRSPGAAHLFVVPRRDRQPFAIFIYSQPPGVQVLVRVLDQYLRGTPTSVQTLWSPQRQPLGRRGGWAYHMGNLDRAAQVDRQRRACTDGCECAHLRGVVLVRGEISVNRVHAVRCGP